jgi:glycosyltransferase involved in cell wall biosynthesis
MHNFRAEGLALNESWDDAGCIAAKIRLKVAILIPVRLGASGGLVKHLQAVVSKMSANQAVRSLSVVAPAGAVDELNLPGVDVRLVSEHDYRTGFREIRQLVEAGGYDVALLTTARPIKSLSCPSVVMVQNVEPIQKPIYRMPLLWRMRLWGLRREHAIACKQATRVLAVSNYVKNEVASRFAIEPDGIDVVYHGFDRMETVEPHMPNLDLGTRPFIFSAGSIVPYRGYEDILRALPKVRAKVGDTPRVVIAGGGVEYARSYERWLRRLACSLKVDDHIVWAGLLRREEMTWCYQNSRIYIQTSRAESFSNIQLEAMGHGCVCVSCDHPPMREILRNAALYYPVGDSGALASTIIMALQMSQIAREAWQTRAIARASDFSWDECADQTVKLLQSAVGGFSYAKRNEQSRVI